MPVLCASCGNLRPFGDFIQISFKADPKGYFRDVKQRANGLHLSEWRSLDHLTEIPVISHPGLYCKHDRSPIIDSMLQEAEKELLIDRRLPIQSTFDGDVVVTDLKDLWKRVRSEVYVHEIPTQEGEFDDSISLPGWMSQKLSQLGIQRLYKHQTEAIKLIRGGRNVVVCTKTASGKSLVYNLPILERMVMDSEVCALYLSPFKALVEDQFAHLKEWSDSNSGHENLYSMDGFAKIKVNHREIATGVLHGQRNTPEHLRKDQSSQLVFEEGRYLLTNVHYLHLILQSVIGQNKKGQHLARFLQNLRFVVIDELHQYSGVLGSKVSMVLRRLRMLCERLGNRNIQFIACSATISNPKYLVEELTAKRGIHGFHEVVGGQAPTKKKSIFLWNPGYSELENNKRRSPVTDLYDVLRTVYQGNRWPRVIIFTSNRQQVQLLSRDLNIIIKSHLQECWDSLSADTELFLPYHAYLPPDTRKETIEKLEQGEILGLVTTSALEVGIDVKCLDLCIMLGYPGSQASFWQQAGRVGRSRDGVVIMMLQEEPLQQFFARNPEEFFKLPAESAVVNTANSRLVSEHMLYAAHEQAGKLSNAINYFRPSIVRKIVGESTEWQEKSGVLYYEGETPRLQTLITMGETYMVVSKNGWNEEILFQNVDQRSLIRDYHVDAVFLGSDNRTYYKVKWINNRQRKIVAELVRSDYVTRGIIRDSLEIREVNNTSSFGLDLKVNVGNILVKRSTFGYKKIYSHSLKLTETIQLENMYPVAFQTEAFWVMWEEEGKQAIRSRLKDIGKDSDLSFDDLCEGSLHTVEHTLAAVIPAIIRCSMVDFQHASFYSGTALFGMPGMFFYDNQPGGGSGIVEAIMEKFEVLLERAYQLVRNCSCVDGCPSCIQLSKCERQNETLHKAGGIAVLEMLSTGIHNSK